MTEDNKLSLETRLAQACHYIDQTTGGISPPIQFSTSYARDADYRHMAEYSYARSGNPSWRIVEEVCAQSDGGADPFFRRLDCGVCKPEPFVGILRVPGKQHRPLIMGCETHLQKKAALSGHQFFMDLHADLHGVCNPIF